MSGRNPPAGYTASQRRAIAAELDDGRAPVCPACGTALSIRPVAPDASVSYVRQRVWVLCPSCRRSAGIDVRRR